MQEIKNQIQNFSENHNYDRDAIEDIEGFEKDLEIIMIKIFDAIKINDVKSMKKIVKYLIKFKLIEYIRYYMLKLNKIFVSENYNKSLRCLFRTKEEIEIASPLFIDYFTIYEFDIYQKYKKLVNDYSKIWVILFNFSDELNNLALQRRKIKIDDELNFLIYHFTMILNIWIDYDRARQLRLDDKRISNENFRSYIFSFYKYMKQVLDKECD